MTASELIKKYGIYKVTKKDGTAGLMPNCKEELLPEYVADKATIIALKSEIIEELAWTTMNGVSYKLVDTKKISCIDGTDTYEIFEVKGIGRCTRRTLSDVGESWLGNMEVAKAIAIANN
jgi:hypothetical protein